MVWVRAACVVYLALLWCGVVWNIVFCGILWFVCCVESSVQCVLVQGAEKIQGAKEGSLPERCKTEGRLLIRKKEIA